MGDKELKVEKLIKEINNLIKPKKEKMVLDDVEMLEDTFEIIMNDPSLYTIALKKYPSRIKILEYLYKNQIKLIELQDNIINSENDSIDFEVELPQTFTDDDLIILNYLYNLIMNAYISDRTINIRIYQKEVKQKINSLQRK